MNVWSALTRKKTLSLQITLGQAMIQTSAGCNSSHSGDDFHLGAMNVPSAIQAWAYAITLEAGLIGENH